MSLTLTTPVLPIIDSSCDAVDTVNGRIYLVIELDSDNNIFLKVPYQSPNGLTSYKWYVLDKTALNYPATDILQVNCSISWTQETGVMFQVCASTATDVHVYDPSTANTGQILYTWSEEEAPASPYLPNPWGSS